MVIRQSGSTTSVETRAPHDGPPVDAVYVGDVLVSVRRERRRGPRAWRWTAAHGDVALSGTTWTHYGARWRGTRTATASRRRRTVRRRLRRAGRR